MRKPVNSNKSPSVATRWSQSLPSAAGSLLHCKRKPKSGAGKPTEFWSPNFLRPLYQATISDKPEIGGLTSHDDRTGGAVTSRHQVPAVSEREQGWQRAYRARAEPAQCLDGDPEASAECGVSNAGRVSHLARDRGNGLLENGGRLEHAQQMAGHESPRTTKLYDRTKDEITLSEVERIRL
jgi:hypothetical protein